jgi:ribosome-associated translation inhibitor RaiA
MNKLNTPDPVLNAVPIEVDIPAEWLAMAHEKAPAAMEDDIRRPDPFHEQVQSGNRVFAVSLVVAVLYAMGAFAFLIGVYGIASLINLTPVHQLTMGFVAVGPALLIGLIGYGARELVRFKQLAMRLSQDSFERLPAGRTHALLDPDAMANAADDAIARLADLEQAFARRMGAIQRVTQTTQDDVEAMVQRLGAERRAVESLSGMLDRQIGDLSEAVHKHQELVAVTMGTLARDAEKHRDHLIKVVSQLKDAASEAGRASEKVAFAVNDQFADVGDFVKLLSESARHLDHAASAHKASVTLAKRTADELSLANEAGTEEMRRAVDSALEQARRMMETVHGELRRIADTGEAEIARVQGAARDARDLAEEGQRAMENQADLLMDKVTMLNARNLGIAKETETGFDARLQAMERAIGAIDAKLSEIPKRAEAKARDLYKALEDGVRLLERRAGDAATARVLAFEKPERPERAAAHSNPVAGDLGVSPEAAPLGQRVTQPETPALPEDEATARGAAWDWKDVLAGMEDRPGQPATSSAIVTQLRRAGIDVTDVFEAPMLAKLARIHRREGASAARHLVVQSARPVVKAARDYMRKNARFRASAEVFVETRHQRLQAAIKRREAEAVFNLLDDEIGRAYLILDAALAEQAN